MAKNKLWKDNGMEKIYKRLFGENVYVQKKKIKKLLYWTMAMVAGVVILIFIEPFYAEAMIGAIFLMWGWRVFMAAAKVNKITELFDYNVAIFAIVIILWLMIGYLAGIVCFVLGSIRYVQLRKK